MQYFGRYPAIVKEYLQAQRQCRVEMPGITDRGDTLPLAEIEYPIGDKSHHDDYPTEIEIHVGDTVWVDFVGGDTRYPVITGHRCPNINNSADWRRYHHKNMQLIADDKLLLNVGNSQLEMIPGKITLSVGGSKIEITASGIKLISDRIDMN